MSPSTLTARSHRDELLANQSGVFSFDAEQLVSQDGAGVRLTWMEGE